MYLCWHWLANWVNAKCLNTFVWVQAHVIGVHDRVSTNDTLSTINKNIFYCTLFSCTFIHVHVTCHWSAVTVTVEWPIHIVQYWEFFPPPSYCCWWCLVHNALKSKWKEGSLYRDWETEICLAWLECIWAFLTAASHEWVCVSLLLNPPDHQDKSFLLLKK